MLSSLSGYIQKLVELALNCLPCPSVDMAKLHLPKVIAHRGYHDETTVENTMEAFEKAFVCGCWGIEFDVRWTRDGEPIVFHDLTLSRLIPNLHKKVSDLTWSELQKIGPMIPHLQDVITRWGKRLHLMIEVKEVFSSSKQKNKFSEILSSLTPQEDFHILALKPQLFESIDFLPTDCFLSVSELNAKFWSNYTAEHKLAGLTGHYLLVNDQILKKHHSQGQKVGTGFVNSKKVFYRECSRGVDFLFTDNCKKIAPLIAKQSLVTEV